MEVSFSAFTWSLSAAFCLGAITSHLLCVFVYRKPIEREVDRLLSKIERLKKDRDYYADLYSELWNRNLEGTVTTPSRVVKAYKNDWTVKQSLSDGREIG